MSSPRSRRHHEEEEHENHERWLVTYADMVTLLMVLFIVMFAMSVVDEKKFNALKHGMTASTAVLPPPGRRSARAKARRRSAARRHSGVGCTDAPLPGSRRRGSGTRAPERKTTRSNSLTGARSRHPTQVRTGFDVSATLHSSAWPGRDVPRVGVEGGARRAGRSKSPPGRPNAGVVDPPRARESRHRRRAGRRCGCRSGSR